MIFGGFMLIIEIIKAIFLGIIEGITEWLPISSTGHLILFDEFWRLSVASDVHPQFAEEFWKMFEVVIQLGAILAVVVLFWGKLWPFSRKKSVEEKRSTWTLWFKVAMASVPAAFVGIVVDKILESATGKDIDGWFYNAWVVAAALIVYGVLFIVIENAHKNRQPKINSINEISYKTAFLMGIFQMLAIIPGTSRSGSTILGAMLIGLSRSCAAEFSFFMAIPAMAGGSLVKAWGFLDFANEELGGISAVPAQAWLVLTVASVVAFVVSMLAIRFLMDFVKKHSFRAFGIYRIALGIAVLGYFIVKAAL